jgi:hypothetical protein
MSDELKIILREAVVACSKVLSQPSPGVTKEYHRKHECNGVFAATSPIGIKCYRLRQLAPLLSSYRRQGIVWTPLIRVLVQENPLCNLNGFCRS